ncbi:potassium channel protein [Desulfocucumis palustris]|uniref:Potassium channel protein n=1 Tax=Desulfocucumis palustris TaxID=1898651 RepID=A0A2L2XEQ7_9FIRM|nr:potassium channel family protein [Desulfocucumis palustris]GBF34622.1 potassium channel protein [Desulfocucumis palustris]
MKNIPYCFLMYWQALNKKFQKHPYLVIAIGIILIFSYKLTHIYIKNSIPLIIDSLIFCLGILLLSSGLTIKLREKYPRYQLSLSILFTNSFWIIYCILTKHPPINYVHSDSYLDIILNESGIISFILIIFSFFYSIIIFTKGKILIRLMAISIFVYVFVWYGCANAYLIAANITAGRAFYFNEDLSLDRKLFAFKEKMKLPSTYYTESNSEMHIKVPAEPDIIIGERDKAFIENLPWKGSSKELDDSIRQLLIKQEYKRNFNNALYVSSLKFNTDKRIGYFKDGVMGDAWAYYYTQWCIANKYKQFLVKEMKDDFLIHVVTGDKGYAYILDFFSDNDNCEYSTYIITSKAIDFSKTIYFELVNPGEHIVETKELYWIIKDSFVALDENSPIILEKVARGSYSYSFWDFAYFSAITITTLGYGDILPNNTIVRTIVIIELLFGLAMSGLFLSSCFSWIVDSRNKKKILKTAATHCNLDENLNKTLDKEN